MLLGLDIGNTHIVTGLFDKKGNLILKFRIASNDNLTEDEFFSYLKNISDFNKVDISNIQGIVISSVVPNLTSIFEYLSKKYFKLKPLIIDSEIKLPFSYADNIKDRSLGADRIVNISEVIFKYPNNDFIIIDFGTATTFEIVSNKKYVGGCILTGINLSLKALYQNTAKLPKVKFEKPENVFGKNTVDHIKIGAFYGSIGQIKEIIRQIKKEIKNPFIITTGGLSEIISNEIDEINECNSDLSINGLYSIYKYNQKN